MGIKQHVRNIVKSITGTHVYRTLPRGVDVAEDIARSLPLQQMEVVFDVGANVGQSAELFALMFPRAVIHCFEPVKETFQILARSQKRRQRVSCHQMALAAVSGPGEMVLHGESDLFYLNNSEQPTGPGVNFASETVRVATLDDFCSSENIRHINYLKIDTEGGDLAVLQGAEQMLSGQRIDLIEVEAGMSRLNTTHASFESLKELLESHGYLLFGMYEQVPEWIKHEPQLRRSNLVFLSQNVATINTSFDKSAA